MSEDECECECGHLRRHHCNGIWECKWCECKGYREPTVPDIFDDLSTLTENRRSEQCQRP